ncbi:MAG: hypothetical protein SGI91_02250 [Alphaproteobacteria bacterium]|nr:hypothetical protein [Alphaproteobacteria bacterium]
MTDERLAREALAVSGAVTAAALMFVVTAKTAARRFVGPRTLHALTEAAAILALLLGGLIVQIGLIAETVPTY